MEPGPFDPLDQLYRRPLLTNALLLFFPSVSYWYMRTHLERYGSGVDMVTPDLGATFFFYATFGLFPLVNLLFFLRALLYPNARLATLYGVIGGVLACGFCVFWYTMLTGLRKIGG